MRLPYLAAALVCDLLLLAPTLVAAECQTGALWLQPSAQWYDDRLCHHHAPRAHISAF